jgi:endogenous inhibitor of DNA gyrase (YacG/DUF329 family)
MAERVTDDDIASVPCAHCGAPSTAQWDLRPCAIGEERTFGLCREHDIDLNRLVLDFLQVPDRSELLATYEASR